MFTAQIYEKDTVKNVLLNRNGIATLNKFIKCISKEALNGEYELEFEYPLDDEKAKYIKAWNIIKAGGQLFRIYNINEDMINHTLNAKARHIFYPMGQPISCNGCIPVGGINNPAVCRRGCISGRTDP